MSAAANPSRWQRAVHLAVLLAVAAATLQLVWLTAATIGARIRFPYALEWLEGWTIDCVRRVLEGHSLWVRPTLEWVPYTYTPVYTYASAALSALLGIGFLAPRLVSLASTLGCAVLIFELVHLETKRQAWAVAALGLFAGTYPLCGAWFDIGRVDTLFLFFLLLAIRGMRAEPSHRNLALSALAASLAYLTKQTALLPMAAMALHSFLELRGRQRFTFGLVSFGVVGLATLGLSLATDGWYFFYTYRVPAAHGFNQAQFLVDFWTIDLGEHLMPAALLAVFYLVRRSVAGHLDGVSFYSTMTVALLGSAWLSRLHAGGFYNVLQPAHAMLAILFGLGLDDLARRWRERWFTSLAAAGIAVWQLLALRYDPTPHIPQPRHVAAGDAMVRALAAIDGDVFAPMHGHLPTLAGKKSYITDDYLWTILRSEIHDVTDPLEAEFVQAFAAQRFAAVVVDHEDYRYMPHLRRYYRYDHDLPPHFRARREPLDEPLKVYVPR